MQTES